MEAIDLALEANHQKNQTERLYVEARKALFMCATSCQGGASDAGMAAAKVLGIPFPIKINSLVAQALKEGFDPFELWSWYPRASLKAIVEEVGA